MIQDVENLPDNLEALKAIIGKLKQDHESAIKARDDRIGLLEELLRYANYRHFAPSSERWEGQRLLFDEAEDQATDKPKANDKKTITYQRGKPKRKPIPEEFRRVNLEYDLKDDEKVCGCGSQMKQIGEVVSEQLDIIPAVVQVLRHIRKKYACSCCKKGVRTAKMPKQMIQGGLPSPNLLAHVAVCKYADGLPLYRQEGILKRAGMDLDRGSMASWMIKLGQSLQPMINLMRDDLLDSRLLHVDETTVQVLKEKGRKAKDKSYIWVQASGNNDPPIVLFDYDPSGSARVAKNLLADYTGTLMTDGYQVYDLVANDFRIRHCACWDHARRKFHDVIKGRKPNAAPGLADEALWYIGRLYEVDRKQNGATPNRRLHARKLYSKSILDHLYRWLLRVIDTVPPKSKLGDALHYLYNRWDKLLLIMEDGTIPLSNAKAENAIRPFVIGRKNWLFSDTPGGAEASCAIYSIIESAKANGLDPFRYLSYVIAKLPNIEAIEDYEKLMPHRIQLPTL